MVSAMRKIRHKKSLRSAHFPRAAAQEIGGRRHSLRMGNDMKRAIQTLLALATAIAACSPALAAGEKEERFVLSSAAEPTHRTDNTAAVASVMPSSDKKDEVFAIGLEALKWV